MAQAKADPNVTPVVEVQEKHRIDVKKLEDYMAAHVDGFEGPVEIGQFEGGQSCPTYKLTAKSGQYVVRRKPPGKLLPSAHAVDREYRVMSALNKVNFEVPRAYCMCEDESVLGTIFYIMEFKPGRVFWNPTLEGLTPEERGKVYDSMNDVMARLHMVDYKSLGLEDFGKPGNYFARQISRWSKQYVASETRDVPEMNKLMEWLPNNIPAGDESCIVHGDYSLHNILFHPTEPRVSAVLDWEISTLGHPLGDLTYNTMNYFAPPAKTGRPNLSGADLKALGIPSFEEYVAKYCERTGRDPIPDNHLAFYKAYNLFRLGAILQGIVGRVRDGTANDPNAAANAERVIPLAQAAWQQAKIAGAGD